ncbi:beta-ketoacyl-[acyl-carrier-protein] synthase family protein [Streptomyces capparidis]
MNGRVVVTGIGALTAAGFGTAALWEGLLRGAGHAARLEPPAPPGMAPAGPAYVAALPEPPVREYLGRRGVRTLSPESTAFAVAAVAARRAAGFEEPWDTEPSAGVAAGTTTAGLADYVGLFAGRLERGAERVNPAQGPQTGLNAPASVASIFTGAAGPNLTVSTGRAAAVDALAASARAVRSGEAATVLAGGVHTVTWYELLTGRGRTPQGRPFDKGRDGAVPGEAAVALALEDAAAAGRRGAAVLAELLGAGAAFCPPDPEGAGPARAARRAAAEALAESGTAPGDIDAVFVSACGDRALDAAEAHAVHELWGASVPVCAVQGGLGDSAGAGGAVQAAAAVLALRAGVLPGTAGHRDPDPELPALRVTTAPEERPLARVLVLAADAGGHAAALVLQAAG